MDVETTACDHITSCDIDEHDSTDCYYRYVMSGNEPGVDILTLAQWSIEQARLTAP